MTSKQNALRDTILDSILMAYGSFDEPNFEFQQAKYKAILRSQILIDLLALLHIQDQTDLNNHNAVYLHCIEAERRYHVCLSLVDNWCAVFKIRTAQYYEAVLTRESEGLLKIEKKILAILEKNLYAPLPGTVLAQPAPIRLFDTEYADTTIYHALISDDNHLPEVLTNE